MYGPTLVELQIITNSDIDQISTVFTWLGAGGITGSLTYGFLYDRFAAAPLLATTLLLLGVVTCLIPVFHWIVTMMILCAIQAFLFNGISIGAALVPFFCKIFWKQCGWLLKRHKRGTQNLFSCSF